MNVKSATFSTLACSVQFKAEVMEVYKSVNVVEFKFYFEDEDSNKIAKGKIQIGII